MFHKNFFVFWKKYKFQSIVVKNTLKLFLVFMLITILPIGGLYQMMMKDAVKRYEEENISAAKKIGATVEALFRDSEYLSAEVMSDSDVVYFMTLGKNTDYSKEEKNNLIDKIKAYTSGKSIIHSVYLYNRMNNMVCNEYICGYIDEFDDVSWQKECDGDYSEGYIAVSRIIDNTSDRVLSLIKKYVNGNAVIVNIDLRNLEKYVSRQFLQNSAFYIIGQSGIMYSNLINKDRNEQIEDELIEMIRNDKTKGFLTFYGKKISAAAEKSSYYNWYYVRIAECGEYNKSVRHTFYITIFAFFLIMLFIIFLSMVLSMNNVSQVVNILDLFENREIYKNLTENEIGEVANKIIYLMDDNEKLKNEITLRNEQYKKWEIKALQTQITPHFLNNTLAVINLEIFDTFNGYTKASDMISQLSRILSYTLVTDKIFVTLDEELEFIRNYAEMLRLRYGNFMAEISADEEIRKKKILRMCLQPLVENSVFHSCKTKGGKINISCRKEGDTIVISIEDNGDGIDKEKIKGIFKSFENDTMSENSIGLKNVYKRLKAVYGENVSMDILSEKGQYTRIVLTVPSEVTDGSTDII